MDPLVEIILRDTDRRITAHENRLTQLEQKMATEESVLARIDTFTTGLGDDVMAITAEIKNLKVEIAAGNTTAVAAAFDKLGPSLDHLETIGSQLHAVASDPANPLPPGSTP